MASCDDDFSLLSDDQTTHHHHHHHLYAPPHRFASKPTPIHAPPHQQIPENLGDGRSGGGAGGGEEVVETEDDETDSAFNAVNPFDESSSHGHGHGHGIVDVGSNEKRKDREEIGDYSNSNNSIKKPKSAASEYRKDREEWSDAAIGCLLEAYLEKFTQLNRGNLRGRDWEEVAAIVSERCEKQTKSVEQCKNKVDNLKKRYKLERHRMTNGGISASHWPWFKKMEEIVGNSLPIKSPVDDDKGFAVAATSAASGNSARQSKR